MTLLLNQLWIDWLLQMMKLFLGLINQCLTLLNVLIRPIFQYKSASKQQKQLNCICGESLLKKRGHLRRNSKGYRWTSWVGHWWGGSANGSQCQKKEKSNTWILTLKTKKSQEDQLDFHSNFFSVFPFTLRKSNIFL